MLKRIDIEKWIGNNNEAYDVIIAGGGPAGIGAALASAKLGAKTLILEARGYFGGVAATSLWMPFNRLLLNGKNRGGVHTLLTDKIKSFGSKAYCEGKISWIDGDGLHIHPDYLRLATLELFEENKCNYSLFSPVVDVVKEGNRLKGIITSYKTDENRYEGNIFIDCTGDGDLSFKAGAKTEIGRKTDNATMFVTLGFAVSNIDIDKFFDYYDKNGGKEKIEEIFDLAEREGYSCSDWYSFDKTTIPGTLSINNGGLKNIGVLNACRSTDLTIAERGGLQVAHDFVKIVKKYKVPGMEECHLLRVGSSLGVRETRRVIGDYIQDIDDAIEGKDFDDIIARRYGDVDLAGLTEDKEYKSTMKSGYAYPYRGLLVSDVEGLLVAGRCGSYTHLGLAAGKSMGNMMEIGQAAGVAAALSSRQETTPRQLDYREVQKVLRSWNVSI